MGGEAALAEVQQEQFDLTRDSGLIEKHAKDAAFTIAVVYAHRQELDRAFDWSERAYRQRDPELDFIKVYQADPGLKRFAHDSRFTSLLRKMNLPE